LPFSPFSDYIALFWQSLCSRVLVESSLSPAKNAKRIES
jgi:hypothetical protein